MAHYEDIIRDKDLIKCKLCSIYIQDDDILIETHVNSEMHSDLEVRRFLIQNSVQVLNNNFYCNICDKTMDKYTLEEHLQGSAHKDKKSKVACMVNADGIFLKLPKDPTEEATNLGVFINCALCDRQMKYSTDAVRHHIDSHKHKRARVVAVQPLNGIFSVEGSNNDLWCKFCRVYFENFFETIFEHIDDKEHKKKVTKILNLIKGQNITIEKFLMDPKEDKAQCSKCNTVVACNVDNLERHIKGKLHTS